MQDPKRLWCQSTPVAGPAREGWAFFTSLEQHALSNDFTAYNVNGELATIRTAPLERDWMDATPQKYAYRCLPLNIANGLGWQVLNEVETEITWDGGIYKESAKVTTRGDGKHHLAPLSHFGSGIITWHVNALFRTPPGIQLLAMGPTNQPLPGIHPLNGVIETSWAPYTFTMNWLMTVKNEPVVIPKGFPICQIVPINLDAIESLEPVVKPLTDDPALHQEYLDWSASRNNFNAGLATHQQDVVKEGWQKNYFRGKHLDGRGAEDTHRTKVKLKEFAAP